MNLLQERAANLDERQTKLLFGAMAHAMDLGGVSPAIRAFRVSVCAALCNQLDHLRDEGPGERWNEIEFPETLADLQREERLYRGMVPRLWDTADHSMALFWAGLANTVAIRARDARKEIREIKRSCVSRSWFEPGDPEDRVVLTFPVDADGVPLGEDPA